MSERAKNVLLAKFYILVNAGMKVSEGMMKAVEKIERERMAVKVAEVRA